MKKTFAFCCDLFDFIVISLIPRVVTHCNLFMFMFHRVAKVLKKTPAQLSKAWLIICNLIYLCSILNDMIDLLISIKFASKSKGI